MDTDKSSLARGGAADAIGGMRMFDFGKSPVEKGENIEKVFKALAAAKNDPDVAGKASDALKHLNENGVKRDAKHLVF